MKLSTLSVLSKSDIKKIHEASIDILEQCGVKILNQRMLSSLKEKGLGVDMDSQIVRFSRSCIETSLSTIPRQFEVYNREGDFAFVLGDGNPKIAAGHNAVFWVDTETGKTRPSTVADVELCARICEELERIDVIGIPVMPQDVPDPEAALLYGVKACIENCRKPVYFSSYTAKETRYCIELLKAAFAGDIKTQPYGICQISPTSPLFWEGPVIDTILETVDTGVPIAVLPEPIAGISAPYTLAGLLTMCNAECLAGLIMIQMLRPGTKVMYANSWTTADMRTGAAMVGSTETTLCRIAGAQLARFYNVPSHTTAPNSDNHAHDEQNAWEKSFSLFCSVAAGHDLIVNCGMFATGMTFSHEQLIMDDEMSAVSQRIKSGIKVNQETIAKDLIKKIGPQGETYLTTDHTLNWLRSDEYIEPRISVSGPFASWQAKGAKDTYQLAREKTIQYAELKPKALSSDVKSKLTEIIASF